MSLTPVYSPLAPAMGWKVKAFMPVTSQSHCSASYRHCRAPWASSPESWASMGCMRAKPGSEATYSVNLGLYFMVQEPRG